MTGGLTNSASSSAAPQPGQNINASNSPAARAIVVAAAAQKAQENNVPGAGGGSLGPSQVPNASPVPNTTDVLNGLAMPPNNPITTPSAGIDSSTVFNKADTFSAGHGEASFDPAAAWAQGYQVIPDSNAKGGYLLSSGGNVIDINGNFLYSTSPGTATKTSNGVSAPASLPNAPQTASQATSSQAANPPLDYQQFASQAAATIKPVTTQVGSEQAQVYQVSVDGATYITSTGYQGDNINGKNAAIDEAYNLYQQALNAQQNQTAETGIGNTITGADANTGQINLEYNLPQTSPAQTTSGAPTYTVAGAPLTEKQNAGINAVETMNIPPAIKQALEDRYLTNTLNPTEAGAVAVANANAAANAGQLQYNLTNASQEQQNAAALSLGNTSTQQLGFPNQTQTIASLLAQQEQLNQSQQNKQPSQTDITLSNSQLSAADKASPNLLTISNVEQLLNNFGKSALGVGKVAESLANGVNPIGPYPNQSAKIANAYGTTGTSAAIASTFAGVGFEIYNLGTRVLPEALTGVLNSGNRLLNGASQASYSLGNEEGYLVGQYLKDNGIPNNPLNVVIYGLSPASVLVSLWATKTPQGQATLDTIKAASPTVGQSFANGLQQQTLFQETDPKYLQKSIADFAAYSNNVQNYIQNNHNAVSNFIASVPLGFSEAVQTGNQTSSPFEAVLANVIIAAYLAPEIVVGAPLEVAGDAVTSAIEAGTISLGQATALKFATAEIANSAFMLGISNIYNVMTTGTALNTKQDLETLALALAVPGALEGISRGYRTLINPTRTDLSVSYGTLAPESEAGQLNSNLPPPPPPGVGQRDVGTGGVERLALPQPSLPPGTGPEEPTITVQKEMNPYGSETRGQLSTYKPLFETVPTIKYEATDILSATQRSTLNDFLSTNPNASPQEIADFLNRANGFVKGQNLIEETELVPAGISGTKLRVGTGKYNLGKNAGYFAVDADGNIYMINNQARMIALNSGNDYTAPVAVRQAHPYEYVSPYTAEEQARIMQAIAPKTDPLAAFEVNRYLLQERQPIQLTLGDQVYEIGSPATRTTQAEALGSPSAKGLPAVKVAGTESGFGGTEQAFQATGQKGNQITKQAVTINNGHLTRVTYSTTRFGAETTMVEQFDFESLQPNGDQQNSLNLRVSKNRIVVYDRFLAPEEIMAVVDGGGLDVKPIKSATLAVNYKTTLATSTPLNKIPINLPGSQVALEPSSPLRLQAAQDYMDILSGNLPERYTPKPEQELGGLKPVGTPKQTVAGTIGTTKIGPEPVGREVQQYNLNIQNNPITPTASGFSATLSNGETTFNTFEGINPQTGHPIYSIIMQEVPPNVATERATVGNPSPPSYSSGGAKPLELGTGTGGPTSTVNLNPITLGRKGLRIAYTPYGPFGEAAYTGERPLFTGGEANSNIAYSSSAEQPTINFAGTPQPTTPPEGKAIPTGNGQFQIQVEAPATTTAEQEATAQQTKTLETQAEQLAKAAEAVQGIPQATLHEGETVSPEGMVTIEKPITKEKAKIAPPQYKFANYEGTYQYPIPVAYQSATYPAKNAILFASETAPPEFGYREAIAEREAVANPKPTYQTPTPQQIQTTPPQPTKKPLEPPTILLPGSKAAILKHQAEVQASGKAFGIYHPEFNLIGDQGQLSAGAELGIGSRPQLVTTADVATLNSQGIAVPIGNMATPSAAPQAVQTQQGTILVDPLTTEEVSAQAASAGVANPNQLIQNLSPNLRLMLNSMPDVGPELAQSLEAADFTGGVQGMGTAQAPPGVMESLPVQKGQPMGIAQAQIQGMTGMAQQIPQSPMLAQNPNPVIQSDYLTIQQLLNQGAITLDQYNMFQQALLQQSLAPNGLLQTQQDQARPVYPVAQRRQLAEVLA